MTDPDTTNGRSPGFGPAADALVLVTTAIAIAIARAPQTAMLAFHVLMWPPFLNDGENETTVTGEALAPR